MKPEAVAGRSVGPPQPTGAVVDRCAVRFVVRSNLGMQHVDAAALPGDLLEGAAAFECVVAVQSPVELGGEDAPAGERCGHRREPT